MTVSPLAADATLPFSVFAVASWFLSPVLSGVISIVLFLIVRTLVLRRPEPMEPGLRSLPFFYGFTILINVFSVVHDGPTCEHFVDYLFAIISHR